MAEIGRHVIVVGVDRSEPSKSAVLWAVHQAELTGAELRLVQAWRTPVGYGMPVDYFGADFEGRASERLRQTVDDLFGERPPVPTRCEVREGPAAAVLTAAARDADALVVGSHGHGAFAGMLLGSVSQHCVQHATCPVVVVRAG
jgi:nucleotide-binding universal stress UspA family protein